MLADIKKKYSVNVEVMSTINALGTYNILSEEGRRVAAFLIPHEPCREALEPYYVSKKDYAPLERSQSLAPRDQQAKEAKDKVDAQPTVEARPHFKQEFRATRNTEEKQNLVITMTGKIIIWIAERFGKKKK
eukprot:gene7710-9029_t